MSAITIGLDIGTTGVKGIALDSGRGLLAQASRPNSLASPHPGWAEASTAQWFDNVIAILEELTAVLGPDASRVAAIATTGMVPAVVAVDDCGGALRPAILQNDARAAREVAELTEELAERGVLIVTGSPVTQQSVAPTARWLQRAEPEVWAQTRALVGSYDWVLQALGAAPHVERNWALESGLFTIEGERFSPAITAGGLDDRLAPVVRSGALVGCISADIAARCGLPASVVLVAGGADHVLSAYGAGLHEPGDWLIKLGGAGDILAVSASPVVDDRFYLDEHPVDGLWLPNGCMATSGSLVRWVQSVLGEDDLAALDASAAQRPAADVLCLPYFLGEKSPINDPDLRGVFAGLHLGHDRHDIYRSALEGIAFGFRHNAEVLRSAGLPLEAATVTNGGSTSMFWKRIHASVLGIPLRTVKNHPGASLGAAIAAAIAIGALDDWSEVTRFVAEGEAVDPDADLVERYSDAYGLWRDLSANTAGTMRALSRR
ncbi:MAG: carbohydrate kinase [Microbacterium sp.]|uniref:FGGY-family carbohydrate kinase n=1 Tax=Microbacterium sp. TaxID=51671 RepID=UPI000DB86A18|nr:FGGY family carbohydrate kinase [Microbacterium sp.]PZU39899.1 MAG: carbohydrate kinase [Microbacterium sp.]